MSPQDLGRTHVQLLERLHDDSARLEALPSSLAFETFLYDHRTEFRGVLSVAGLDLRRHEISPALIERHGFPTIFNIRDLRAELIQLPEDTLSANELPSWHFRADYTVGDEPFSLSTNGVTTSLSKRNNDGVMTSYGCENGLASQLMAAVAFGFSRAQNPGLKPIGNLYNDILSDSGDQLRQSMQYIAGLGGAYETSLTAAIHEPGSGTESGRALLMTLTDSNDDDGPGSSATFHMAWHIGGDFCTELVSHQRMQLQDEGSDRSGGRFAERFVSAVPPDHLAYYLGGTADRDAVIFEPDRLELGGYESVNAAIMAVLRGRLKPYEYLDEFAA